MERVRDFISGKRTYLTAVAGVIGALLAWSAGEIDTAAFISALWGAVACVFLRRGVTNEVKKLQDGK